MNNDEINDKDKDNTLAHAIGSESEDGSKTYDPDRYVPKSASIAGEENQQYAEEVPLEQAQPRKGYSTDPAQGKDEASLHLADEDMDRTNEDPEQEAENLKESYEKSQRNATNE
jgi:hypothetical protein